MPVCFEFDLFLLPVPQWDRLFFSNFLALANDSLCIKATIYFILSDKKYSSGIPLSFYLTISQELGTSNEHAG